MANTKILTPKSKLQAVKGAKNTDLTTAEKKPTTKQKELSDELYQKLLLLYQWNDFFTYC